MTDHELLARYAADGSHDAFAELARRYTDMVYATCLRILDDKDAAEDATQATFVVLMKKAGGISDKTVLPGWLFQTARNSARLVRKKAIRRAKHEREAAAMRATEQKWSGEASWDEIRPHVDDALAALPAKYRDVIVLRYLQGISEAEAARILGCKEGAVAMRLSRGLQKLRARLRRKGVIVTGALLGMLLGTETAQAAPAEIAASISAAGATGSTVTGIAEGVMKMMMWAKIKTAATILLAATAVGVVGAGIVRTNVTPEATESESEPDMNAAATEPSSDGNLPPEANAPAIRNALPEDAAAWPWGQQVGGLQSRIVLERRRFRQGEPIVAEVQIRSVGYSKVPYDPRPVETAALTSWSYFQVIGPDGSEVPNIGGHVCVSSEAVDYVYPTLATGDSVSVTKRKLHEFLYMRAPGRYQLTWKGCKPEREIDWDSFWGDEVPKKKPREPTAVALPPTATVDIEVLPAPGGAPDGDIVGRLLRTLPAGWRISGVTLLAPEMRVPGRISGRGSSVLLMHHPDPGINMNITGMRVFVMAEAREPTTESADKPAKYLGKGKLGHAYLAYSAGALGRWNHAVYEIAAALEVEDLPPKPTQPDWGRLVCRILWACADRREVRGMGGFLDRCKLVPRENELARIEYEKQADPSVVTYRNGQKLPPRSYKVLLCVRPAGGESALDMTAADRSIRWDGEVGTRGYVVGRLGVEIVMTVTTDNKPFREALNAIFDREISRVLAETAGE